MTRRGPEMSTVRSTLLLLLQLPSLALHVSAQSGDDTWATAVVYGKTVSWKWSDPSSFATSVAPAPAVSVADPFTRSIPNTILTIPGPARTTPSSSSSTSTSTSTSTSKSSTQAPTTIFRTTTVESTPTSSSVSRTTSSSSSKSSTSSTSTSTSSTSTSTSSTLVRSSSKESSSSTITSRTAGLTSSTRLPSAVTTGNTLAVSTADASKQKDSSDSSTNNGALSTGAIAGIAIGCGILSILVVGLVVFCLMKRRRHRKDANDTLSHPNAASQMSTDDLHTGTFWPSVAAAPSHEPTLPVIAPGPENSNYYGGGAGIARPASAAYRGPSAEYGRAHAHERSVNGAVPNGTTTTNRWSPRNSHGRYSHGGLQTVEEVSPLSTAGYGFENADMVGHPHSMAARGQVPPSELQ